MLAHTDTDFPFLLIPCHCFGGPLLQFHILPTFFQLGILQLGRQALSVHAQFHIYSPNGRELLDEIDTGEIVVKLHMVILIFL